MFNYIIRRLLLMIPTFFGTTIMVFTILQYVPGGPFERAVMQLKFASMMSGESASAGGKSISDSQTLTPEILEDLRMQYGLDKPVVIRYLIWLGIWPKEIKNRTVNIGETFRENIDSFKKDAFTSYTLQKWIKPVKDKTGEIIVTESGVGIDIKNADFEPTKDFQELPNVNFIKTWYHSTNWKIAEIKSDSEIRIIQKSYQGLFTGYLGYSNEKADDVGTLIKNRLHISLIFGLTSFILVYLICIPLGIMKAIKHGSKFDVISSSIVFIGYSIPGYALGTLLLVYFAGENFMDIFPLGGWRSENWNNLTFMGKVFDQIHHAILPILCYMVGSFATLTVLMKNSLMENLSQDYVRTAFAKGLSEKSVILFHAVRNSLIPIATNIGHVIGLFIVGSYVIEKVFGIDGIGMLSFTAIITRDYPIIMGFLVINTIVRLFGNLFSDIAYATIDPRIRFK